jgi:hypothetical protein
MSDANTLALIKYGDDVIYSVVVDGKPHVVLKPAVESIGLDYWTQAEKLKGRSWATTGLCPVVAKDGKTREMVTVDVRTFLMLLATVDESRVAEHVRPKLVAYQNEVADVIEAYWKGTLVPRDLPSALRAYATEIERR